MAENKVRYRLVVVGGSAGSLDVILSILNELKELRDATLVVIVHRRTDNSSILSDLLMSKTKMKVKEVEDKEPILPGHVYVAPSDYHLLIENEELFSLDASERVHYSRPSIDVSFESIAQVFGERVIGVLLSGANADGAAGLRCIRENGGVTIAQDPGSAEVAYMPQQAIVIGAATEVIRGFDIGKRVRELIGE